MEQQNRISKTKNGEGVSLSASPIKTLQDGKRVAKALKDVVTQNGWAIQIGGHSYLQFEAWQTIAQFYGCSVSTSEIPEAVKYNEVEGFQAKASILDKKTGTIIGGATALCLNDEKNWINKPLFQLSSMAQTRAGSKALRQMFSWVVVLAGYKPTPAEEMIEEIKPTQISKPKYREEQLDANLAPAISVPSNNQKIQTETSLQDFGSIDIKFATQKQVNLLKIFLAQGRIEELNFEKLSIKEASELIEKALKTKPESSFADNYEA